MHWRDTTAMGQFQGWQLACMLGAESTSPVFNSPHPLPQVINATGPFVDAVRQMSNGGVGAMIMPSRRGPFPYSPACPSIKSGHCREEEEE